MWVIDNKFIITESVYSKDLFFIKYSKDIFLVQIVKNSFLGAREYCKEIIWALHIQLSTRAGRRKSCM